MLPTSNSISKIADSNWVSILSREQTATTSLHQSSYVDSDTEGFVQNCLGQGKTQKPQDRSPWEHDMKSHTSWDIFIYYAMIDEDEGAIEAQFCLRLLDRPTNHVFCHNYPGVDLALELQHL